MNLSQQQYTFAGTAKTVTIGAMIVGVICMALTWMNGDEYQSRFWSNFLHNSSFFLGISMMAFFFICVCITAYAGWASVFKRVWEALGSFMPIGFVLMMVMALAVYLHWNHIYHWADAAAVAEDPILNGKKSFLNPNWYLFGTLIIVGTWVFFGWKMRQLSLQEDSHQGENYATHRKMRVWAAAFLPIMGFSSAAMIWQWLMSVDSHWYSTLYAWHAAVSWFVAMIALTILLLIYLKGKGLYKEVTADHMHDLGKFLFAFSIFWTYMWFSQFMLIWYANVGEETGYFLHRREEYPVLFYANLAINFLVPFFVLMRNDTKRKLGSLSFVAVIVFIGHWIDFFLMIKPGVKISRDGHGHGDHGDAAAHGAHDLAHGAHDAAHGAHDAIASSFEIGYTMPGLLEIGTMIGFLGLFFFVVLTAVSKAPLIAKNDPYLEESLHHHT